MSNTKCWSDTYAVEMPSGHSRGGLSLCTIQSDVHSGEQRYKLQANGAITPAISRCPTPSYCRVTARDPGEAFHLSGSH